LAFEKLISRKSRKLGQPQILKEKKGRERVYFEV